MLGSGPTTRSPARAAVELASRAALMPTRASASSRSPLSTSPVPSPPAALPLDSPPNDRILINSTHSSPSAIRSPSPKSLPSSQAGSGEQAVSVPPPIPSITAVASAAPSASFSPSLNSHNGVPSTPSSRHSNSSSSTNSSLRAAPASRSSNSTGSLSSTPISGSSSRPGAATREASSQAGNKTGLTNELDGRQATTPVLFEQTTGLQYLAKTCSCDKGTWGVDENVQKVFKNRGFTKRGVVVMVGTADTSYIPVEGQRAVRRPDIIVLNNPPTLNSSLHCQALSLEDPAEQHDLETKVKHWEEKVQIFSFARHSEWPLTWNRVALTKQDGASARRWSDARIPGELKESEAKAADGEERCKSLTRLLTGIPGRINVISFAITGNAFTIFLGTTSAWFRTGRTCLECRPEVIDAFFNTVLAPSFRLDRPLYSVSDSLSKTSPNDPSRYISLNLLPPPLPEFRDSFAKIKSIRVDNALAYRRSIVGRGTSVVAVTVTYHDGTSRKQAFKTSWPDAKHRGSESAVYKRIDNATPLEREGLAKASAMGEDVDGSYGLPGFELPAATPGTSSKVSQRIFRWVLLDSVLLPIQDAKPSELPKFALQTVEEFLSAAAHRRLFQLGFLHQDISLGNLMISEGAERSVVLCDFDLAVGVQEDGERLEGSRAANETGTIQFMSCRLTEVMYNNAEGLQKINYTQTAIDDLESILWVFLYILLTCGKLNETGRSARRAQMVDSWSSRNAAAVKAGMLFSFNEIFHEAGEAAGGEYAALFNFFVDFYQAATSFHSQHDFLRLDENRSLPPLETTYADAYEKVIETLQKYVVETI